MRASQAPMDTGACIRPFQQDLIEGEEEHFVDKIQLSLDTRHWGNR